MLTQRPASARSSLKGLAVNPFYLDAAMVGGRMTYDVPITSIE